MKRKNKVTVVKPGDILYWNWKNQSLTKSLPYGEAPEFRVIGIYKNDREFLCEQKDRLFMWPWRSRSMANSVWMWLDTLKEARVWNFDPFGNQQFDMKLINNNIGRWIAEIERIKCPNEQL